MAIGKFIMTAARKTALLKAQKASVLARKKNAVKVISPRQQRNLAKLQSRIKANKSALKEISGKDTVFRLQNKKGQGPLMKRVVPPKSVSSNPTKNKPFPVQRHQDINSLKKSMPDEHFEYLDFKRGEKFGFKSPQQAAKWFSKQELDWYSQRGYTLQKIQNVKVKSSSKSQLTFASDSRKSKLLRDRNKLLKKYSKLSK